MTRRTLYSCGNRKANISPLSWQMFSIKLLGVVGYSPWKCHYALFRAWYNALKTWMKSSYIHGCCLGIKNRQVQHLWVLHFDVEVMEISDCLDSGDFLRFAQRPSIPRQQPFFIARIGFAPTVISLLLNLVRSQTNCAAWIISWSNSAWKRLVT